MAPLFAHSSTLLLLFFFLIPNYCFSLPCPIHPPCDSSIELSDPFYTNNNMPGCNQTYLVQCIESKLSIKFPSFDAYFTVKNIDYNEQIIALEYEQVATAPLDLACGFVYNFTDPFHHFDHYPSLFIDSAVDSCNGGNKSFPLLNRHYNYRVCKNFSFSHHNESEKDLLSPSCQTQRAPFFEWSLSFSRYADNGLSLLSAGYSYHLELRPDCLNAAVCDVSAAEKHTKQVIFAASVGGATTLVAACCICLWRYSSISRKKDLKNNQNVENFLKKHGSLAPKRYKYSDVKKITESFRHKLGQGGYGSVFKGTLGDGCLVAVKVLSESKGNGEDFFNEIASIGRSSHVNIVNMLGFCLQGSKRALIYEYMCNGSLDKLICSEKQKTTPNWEKLYQIAIGIARGLEYLHRGSNTRIVHFDIKPHNILLDEDFCPKISDFGLSKLCLRKDSILSMEGTRGTVGYIAPEVFSRNFGVVSSKSDVYSYGMMVLEMAGGRENVPLGLQNTSETYFPYSIYKHLEQNQGMQVYGATAESEELVRKMILIGLWCIQTMPQNRPSITKVIEMLEGSVDDLQVPPKPYLSFPSFGPIVDVSYVCDSCSICGSSTFH